MTVSDEYIAIPKQLQIPGIQLRPIRMSEDFTAMADIYNRDLAALGVTSMITPERLEHQYKYLTNSKGIIVEHNRQVIAYGRIRRRDEADGLRNYAYIFRVLPEWWNQGIEQIFYDYYHQQALQWSQEFPTHESQVLTTVIDTPALHLKPLLEHYGYQPIRYGFNMSRNLQQSIPVRDLPSPIEIRPATPEHYRQIWEADVEAFRDHWGMHELGEADYQAWMNSKLFQPHIWQIAWQNDEVVGMVQNYINHEENAIFNRQRGYTEGISTRRPWRKQGIASALIARSMSMFKELGMSEVALGLDAQNPNGALSVYEQLGYTVEYQTMTYRKALCTE